MILQRVRSPRGLDCGALLWESKNAKHWNNAWVAKLRSDQQAERADVAIIVTPALPEGVNRMAFHDGVWICDFASATTLATALRHSLVEIAQARVIDSNRSQALDEVYEYLCGKEFQHRVTNTVAAALVMKEDLDSERRASERLLRSERSRSTSFLRNMLMIKRAAGNCRRRLQPVAALELPPHRVTERSLLRLPAEPDAVIRGKWRGASDSGRKTLKHDLTAARAHS